MLRKDRKDFNREKGSRGHNKKITDDLKMKIDADTTISMGNLGKASGISKRSIGRAISFLSKKSYVGSKRQLLSERTRATRVAKGTKLLSWIKHNGSMIRIFSD